MRRWHGPLLTAAAALGCLLAIAEQAASQTFLPPKGEGSVSIVVQQGLIIYHLLPDHEFDRGSTRWNTVYADLTYGLRDRLALSVTLPWVRSKYTGVNPHCQVDVIPCPSSDRGVDDGSYHDVVTDLRAMLLYNLKPRGLVITAFGGAIVPTHDYPYFNHSAGGRRLFEPQVGVAAARFLDPVLPDAYAQVRYAFGMPQHVLGLSHNRSILTVEAGYMIGRVLQLFVLAEGQYTHGGLDFDPDSRAELPWEVWAHHDQIVREHYLHVGAGVAFPLKGSTSAYASVIRAVAGHNGHEIDYLWSVGVNRGFGRSGGSRSR